MSFMKRMLDTVSNEIYNFQMKTEELPNSFNDEFWEEDVIEESFPDFPESVLRLLRRLVRVHSDLEPI